MLTLGVYLIVFLLMAILVIALKILDGCRLFADYLFSIQEILCSREKLKGPIGEGTVLAEISEIKSILEKSGVEVHNELLEDGTGLLAEFAKAWKSHICAIQHDAGAVKDMVQGCSADLGVIRELMEMHFNEGEWVRLDY